MKLTASFLGLTIMAMAMTMISQSAEFDRAQVERDAMRILDEFVRTTNTRETEAHVAILHHPHYRLAHGVMVVHETEAESIDANGKFFTEVSKTEWYRTEWVHKRIVQIGESLVHVDGRFVRLRKDGSEIDTLDALYVLTNQDGRWGIRLRSSFL